MFFLRFTIRSQIEWHSIIMWIFLNVVDNLLYVAEARQVH